jgi:hypothetical protein
VTLLDVAWLELSKSDSLSLSHSFCRVFGISAQWFVIRVKFSVLSDRWLGYMSHAARLAQTSGKFCLLFYYKNGNEQSLQVSDKKMKNYYFVGCFSIKKGAKTQKFPRPGRYRKIFPDRPVYRPVENPLPDRTGPDRTGRSPVPVASLLQGRKNDIIGNFEIVSIFETFFKFRTVSFFFFQCCEC